MQETWVQSLGWEDTPEKGMATHFSILAWRIPWTVQSMGHNELDTTEWLSLHYPIRWPNYWRFSVSISPSNEYSELISFKIDWFVITIIHNILPQGNLRLCLKRLTYSFPEVGHSRRHLQDTGFYFLDSSPSLSYERTWQSNPDNQIFWNTSLPSSQSAGLQNKVIFLASTPRLSDLLACHVVSRPSLVSVTEQPMKFKTKLMSESHPTNSDTICLGCSLGSGFFFLSSPVILMGSQGGAIAV